MTVTSRGERWELLHSLWIIWTLIPLLGWIGFLWVGRQARHPRWLVWGAIYALPLLFVLVMLIIGYQDNSGNSELVGLVILFSPLVPLIHAVNVRKEYLLRREAADQARAKEAETHKASIAAEYEDRDARPRVTGILNQCDALIADIEAAAGDNALSAHPTLQQSYNQALDLRERGSQLLDRASSPYEIERAEGPLTQALAHLQEVQSNLAAGVRSSTS